jgi:hypothetical protein
MDLTCDWNGGNKNYLQNFRVEVFCKTFSWKIMKEMRGYCAVSIYNKTVYSGGRWEEQADDRIYSQPLISKVSILCYLLPMFCFLGHKPVKVTTVLKAVFKCSCV